MTVNFIYSNQDRLSVSPSSMTFTSSNWSTSKNVTFTAIDNAVADADIQVTVSISFSSSDTSYSSLSGSLVVTVKNDDVASIGEPAFTTGVFSVIFLDSNDTITISDKTSTTVTVEVYEKDSSTGIWGPHTYTPTKYLHNDYNVHNVWSDVYQVGKYCVEQVPKSPYWTPTNKVFNYDLLYDDNADD